MPIISWIRDLFGIQKDMYDTKRTRLEIKKLEDAERGKLITPATLDDVKKYDPNTKVLMRAVRKRHRDEDMGAVEPGLMIVALRYIYRRIKGLWQGEDFFEKIHRVYAVIGFITILLLCYIAFLNFILEGLFGWWATI